MVAPGKVGQAPGARKSIYWEGKERWVVRATGEFGATYDRSRSQQTQMSCTHLESQISNLSKLETLKHGYYTVKGNSCWVGKSEILNQAVDSIVLNSSIGVLKGEVESRSFFLKRSEIRGLSSPRLWRESRYWFWIMYLVRFLSWVMGRGNTWF